MRLGIWFDLALMKWWKLVLGNSWNQLHQIHLLMRIQYVCLQKTCSPKEPQPLAFRSWPVSRLIHHKISTANDLWKTIFFPSLYTHIQISQYKLSFGVLPLVPHWLYVNELHMIAHPPNVPWNTGIPFEITVTLGWDQYGCSSGFLFFCWDPAFLCLTGSKVPVSGLSSHHY